MFTRGLTGVLLGATLGGCGLEPVDGPRSHFEASLRGAVSADISGTATSATPERQLARTVPGAPGVAATVIGLFSDQEEHVVSFYVPQNALRTGAVAVRGLNSDGPGIAAGAMYSKRLDAERREVFGGVRGEIVIDSITAPVIFGRFTFEADSSQVIPEPRTLTNGQLIPVLERRTAHVKASGTFAARRIQEAPPPR